MTTDELIIDETNFDQHFFDTRKHAPKPGQVLACYESFAEFIDGNLKRDVLHLLINTTKAESAQRLVQKIAGATAESALKVVQEMTADLLDGMPPAEVATKPYELHLQLYYYTDLANVPTNDPHWWTASMFDCKFKQNDDPLP